MDDDDIDLDLLDLLRQRFGMSNQQSDEVSSDTGVLNDAKHIYDNAIDVSIDMYGTKAAAASIHTAMEQQSYSTNAWSQHDLHPKLSEGFSEVDMVNFIFTMDLLNFSFWSELDAESRYQVEYRGKRWTGYNSLVACLRRALDGGVPITTPRFWSSAQATDEVFKLVFFSATDEQIPLLEQRIALLREAGEVLNESFGDPEEPEGVDDAVAEKGAQLLSAEESDTPDEGQLIEGVEHESEAPDSNQGEAAMSNLPPESRPAADRSQLIGGADQESEVPGSALIDGAVSDVPPESGPDVGMNQPLRRTERESETPVSAQTDALTSDVPPKSSPASFALEAKERKAKPELKPDHSVMRLLEKAEHSAGKLVNLLAKHFPCFRDETRFDGKKVRLLKRAQILAADLWGAFNGQDYGHFDDVDNITMFADYRVPQMLHSLSVLTYSPPLDNRIRTLQPMDSGHSWEVQLRGCSIWAVELIRREILRVHPDAGVNAVLIDFFLYDLAKDKERVAGGLAMPHHRTRSIWY